jgi:rfaE bifunctional protein nucleotidyltransferase chain/domain
VVTPNAAEAAKLTPEVEGDGVPAACERAALLARRWRAVSTCVTVGARGAVLAFAEGAPLAVPAPSVHGGDPCGAGDRFATALAGLLADGELPSRAVAGAVSVASAFVAAGGAGALRFGDDAPEDAAAPVAGEDAVALARRVRAQGGTVVATGGCFDLLHRGHVATLAAARALGDCLIVCLNSDDSVRRLKGPDRPVNAQADRAAVLEALASVDAVAIFGEDTPVEVLRTLRPHLFVKGGDYQAADLPETAALAAWRGRVVTVPYVDGHSTTRILTEAMARGG